MSKMAPLKRFVRLVYGDALASEVREDGEVPVIGSGGPSGFHSRANTLGPAIVIGRKGSYGSTYWEPRDCFVIDTAYSVQRLNPETDMRWLYYALQAVDLKGVSQDVGVPGLSREAAYAVEIPSIPILEQRRIATFLDEETGKIDQLSSLRVLQAGQLEEHEKSWGSRLFASSRSGVWMRVKHLLCARPRYGVLVPEFVDAGVPFIRINNLSGLSTLIGLPMISEDLSSRYSRTVTRLDDVLVSVVGTLGRTAVITENLMGANTARAVAVLRLNPRRSPSLFAAWVGSAGFEQQALLATGSDSAQPTLGMEDLANFSLKWPSDVSEQRLMTVAVKEKKLETAAAYSALNGQLNLLAQRRQALITAAVTGQIDVTTANGVTTVGGAA